MFSMLACAISDNFSAEATYASDAELHGYGIPCSTARGDWMLIAFTSLLSPT